ncbi:hypothetical protein [Cognatishimia maritima]|uniref:Uncharacterized protein n=1 Tax=Cognatishimia maritima TaxID=870908 RepID=A0A1M5I8B6_9RHOB|nr:hypothetical protein [Cognatishimia maritima]SHG24033.1 hypothetical protein SAMN04488044_0217 [Cognatishimia maritima]
MKFILRKILSEKQYINLKIYFIEHPKALNSVFGLIAACLIFYFAFHPRPYEVLGYTYADVLSIQDMSDESGFSVTARIELPDGEFGFASTTSLVIASDAVNSICVEERLLQNNIKRYRWVHRNKCTSN